MRSDDPPSCPRSIAAAYELARTSSAPAPRFVRSVLSRLSHRKRHTAKPQPLSPSTLSAIDALTTSIHCAPITPRLTPEPQTPTAKMVAMYTIAGRQVGSHVVRPPEAAREKFDPRSAARPASPAGVSNHEPCSARSPAACEARAAMQEAGVGSQWDWNRGAPQLCQEPC